MVTLEHVYKKMGEKVLFSDFSLKIEDGTFALLTGQSGCGKSTLLHMIGGLEPVDKGEILVNGLSVNRRKSLEKIYRGEVGFLFQNYVLIDRKTVKGNLSLIDKKCRSEVTEEEALEAVGLSGFEDHKVYQLSGGEQQRVALARLLLKKCSIVLADEPTASVDRKNAEMIEEILLRLNAEGKTVIVATHMPELFTKVDALINLDKNAVSSDAKDE